MELQEAFRTLSDSTRREAVNLLKDNKRSAGDIVSHSSNTNATIFRHPSILRKAGLITDGKQGEYIYYELSTSVIDEIIGWIASLRGEKQRKSRP